MATIMLAREGEAPAVTVADLLPLEADALFRLRDCPHLGPRPPQMGTPAPPGVVRDLSLVWVHLDALDGQQCGLRPGFYFAGRQVTGTLHRLRRYMTQAGGMAAA